MLANRILWEHLPLALFAGLIGSIVFNSIDVFITAMVFGWLVDADHLVDFVYGKIISKNSDPIKISVLSGNYFKKNGKVFIPLHAWEWVAAICMGCLVFDISKSIIFPHMITGCLALFLHLIQDQLSNSVHKCCYFILFRAWNRFCYNKICN